MKDIYGATIPNLNGWFRAFLFPGGMLISLSFTLLIIAVSFYIISYLLYRKITPKDEGSLKSMILYVGGFLIIGGFIPLLTGLFSELLLLFSLFHLIDVKRELKSRDAPQPMKLAIYLLFFMTVLLLFINTIGGIILAFLLGWWVYAWNFFAGVLAGLVLMIIKKPRSLQMYDKPWQSVKTLKLLKLTFIIIPILLSGIFFLSFLPNVHESGPEDLTSTEVTSLNLMTYNIRNGGAVEEDINDQWWNRKEVFVEYLDSFNLDLFCIQEAHYFQIDFIHSHLKSRNYEWTGLGRDDGVHGGEACAIFFDGNKYEYLDGDTFWLSDLPDLPSNTFLGQCTRVCTWARLSVRNGDNQGAQFCVFSTHYDFADDWQVKASNLIAQKILDYSGSLPVFLMGDFNMRNTSVAFPILENYEDSGKNRAMRDAFREYNEKTLGYLPYETTSPQDWDVRKDPTDKSRIDFIFISEQVDVQACRVVKDYYGDYKTYSDHYPVLLNCTF